MRLTAASRPRLARRARLRDDPHRGGVVLLAPEEVFVLNDSAAAVLRLCGGDRDVVAIVATLIAAVGTPGAEAVADEVLGFLQALADRGLVVDGARAEAP